MHDTQLRSAAEPVGKARRTGLIWLVIVVVVAAIGVGAWFIVQGGERTATDVVQDVAKAMRNDDAALLAEVTSGTDPWFLEWLTALRAEPVFTNCTESIGASATAVACDITFGEEFFYSRVQDQQLTSTIGGTVDAENLFSGSSLPPPAGLTDVEADLRAWVRDSRPELEDQLYGSPGYLGLKMTRESGELRMELFDDFMASR